jgi:hypothetical protein
MTTGVILTGVLGRTRRGGERVGERVHTVDLEGRVESEVRRPYRRAYSFGISGESGRGGEVMT